MRGLATALLATLMAAFAGCSWVELTEAGDQVREASRETIDDCRQVGTVTAQTRARVLIARSEQAVREELLVLARNQAAELGATAIVAREEPSEGRQRFDAYRCP